MADQRRSTARGDVGRCVSASLDPNRPDASKIAIAYDDSTNDAKKYAIQSGFGYAITTVDNTTLNGGGYTSLAFEPTVAGDGRYHPAMSYYDSYTTALKFARQNGDEASGWSRRPSSSRARRACTRASFYDACNRPNIFFFKKTNDTAYRAAQRRGVEVHVPRHRRPRGADVAQARPARSR